MRATKQDVSGLQSMRSSEVRMEHTCAGGHEQGEGGVQELGCCCVFVALSDVRMDHTWRVGDRSMERVGWRKWLLGRMGNTPRKNGAHLGSGGKAAVVYSYITGLEIRNNM